MSVHLQRQIKKLKQAVVDLAEKVEESVTGAIDAVENRDSALAQRIIENDDVIDKMEVDLEEECLHTLALHTPVAFDLRYVVAVLKINNDLERIADMATNIAQNAIFLAEEPPIRPAPFNLKTMADRVESMLSRALRAMLDCDPITADAVRNGDDEVDAMHRSMYEQVEAAMRDNPHQIPQLSRYMGISRQLERIADLAVNISEDVLYTARGEIFRHTSK